MFSNEAAIRFLFVGDLNQLCLREVRQRESDPRLKSRAST